ncbi:MAG: HAD-IIIA family hydrolase [Lachnospiraceae bacterium]|nr:HAD-IIIA family hydrolase [Lachnospiraceae bacterium]
MIAVIMAGGKGTRIASVNSDVPKPMIPIGGKPILEYTIEMLEKQGYREIILVIGHLGEIIRNYFQDGSKWNVSVSYIVEDTPLGTAGALFFLKDKIDSDFLLINGDIIFDVDIHKFYECHKRNNCVATILTHPNSHPYDSGLIVAEKDGRVIRWLAKEDERMWYRNRVNAGLHMLSPKVFERFATLQKVDLDRDILKQLIPEGELYIYDSPEYVKDMGTPDRYEAVSRDLETGRVAQRNLLRKQRAIFLDRDGTINKYIGFLRNIEEFELIDGVAEAIRDINESGYLAIVITNQPVIARGDVTVEELREIHNKMETLLGREGAYVDDIFYCPHHPHSGYEGEIKELKIDCSCRKPKPGMLLEAAEKYNIDLHNSWMVGDGDNDMLAGMAAGCKAAGVGNAVTLDNVPIYGSLKECITQILKDEMQA